MIKTVNTAHVEGVLYEHNLAKRVTGPQSKAPGTEYITGDISIATNDDLTNIIKISYTYVTKDGKPTGQYDILNDIFEGNLKSVVGSGADVAVKLRADTSVAVNDFVSNRTEELVSAKQYQGGFIHTAMSVPSDNEAIKETSPGITEDSRNKFECDMVINGFTRVEADENGNPEKGIIKGAVFDFRGGLVPVEFSVYGKAIDYFENLEPTSKNIVFTRVRGKQVHETIVRRIVEEGAFGDSVREVTRNRTDWIITWAKPEVYDFGEDGVLTIEEMQTKTQDRATVVAEVRQRYEDRKKARASANPTPRVATASAGFDF